MNRSFYNGVIGIKSHQTGIDIVANNISNIESTAYKGEEAEFQTIFSQTLTGNYSPLSNDVGLGSAVTSTKTNLQQGSLISTDNTFDMALDSEGWFGVMNRLGEVNYTRDGSFSIDANGDLTNAEGLYLLGSLGDNISPTTLPKEKLDKLGSVYENGITKEQQAYTIKDTGEIPLSENLSKINLPDILYLPPKPTTTVSYRANLDPTIKLDNNGNEIANTEHFTTSIISPKGDKDTLDMTFTKEVPQQQTGSTWNADIKILHYEGSYNPDQTYDPSKYVVYPDQNEVYSIVDKQEGVLTFDSNGALLSNSVPPLSNSGTSLTLNLGTPLDPNISGSGYDGLISLKDNNFSHNVSKDGYVEGYLKAYTVSENGEVLADFDNGRLIPVAKIGVYHFQNDEGLERISGSLFKESANSGKAFFYKDENGNLFNGSNIISHKLEQSNVNLSNAMTELIIMQKAYDANAKCITTSDQMIQKAINMKR